MNSDQILAVLLVVASLAALVIQLYATPNEPADDEPEHADDDIWMRTAPWPALTDRKPEHTTQDAQTTADGPNTAWW